MDLIQENGQPRYGRFESVPSTIHVQHYIYKTPYGKVLKGWRKQLKYKKFKFCGIQHKHYSIGLAIADIGWVGHGFFYIYDQGWRLKCRIIAKVFHAAAAPRHGPPRHLA